jgi:AcrR family transcriptional regulator
MPSVGAIATEAGVSRATIYNHFTSRAALVDAVVEDTVRQHGMDRLVEQTLSLPWQEALTAAVTTCAHFWDAEHALLRRLFVTHLEEPEVTKRLRQREAWRTEQFAAILTPLRTAPAFGDIVAGAVALTSFATYDQLLTHTGSSATAEAGMRIAATAWIKAAAS